MNKKGFTLIELLAVIAVVAIVSVIGITSISHYVRDSREKAFRIEATSLIKAAEKAYELKRLGEITIGDNNDWCSNEMTGDSSFTVSKLRDLGVYTGKNDDLVGKVVINSNNKGYVYKIWLKKGNDLKIINGDESDYINNGELSSSTWIDEYSISSCEMPSFDYYFTYDRNKCDDRQICNSEKVTDYRNLNQNYFVKYNSERSILELCLLINNEPFCVNFSDDSEEQMENAVRMGFEILENNIFKYGTIYFQIYYSRNEIIATDWKEGHGIEGICWLNYSGVANCGLFD